MNMNSPIKTENCAKNTISAVIGGFAHIKCVSHLFIKINVARPTHGVTFGEESQNCQPVINSSFNK